LRHPPATLYGLGFLLIGCNAVLALACRSVPLPPSLGSAQPDLERSAIGRRASARNNAAIPKAGHFAQEAEVHRLFLRHDLEFNVLHPFVHPDEDETRLFAASLDRPRRKTLALEELIHAPVGHPGADELERHQRHQGQVQPRQKAKAQKPFPNREVVDIGSLERRVVGGIHAQEIETVRPLRPIEDADPQRLDASVGHPHPEMRWLSRALSAAVSTVRPSLVSVIIRSRKDHSSGRGV
jgi:hypothetical protein